MGVSYVSVTLIIKDKFNKINEAKPKSCAMYTTRDETLKVACEWKYAKSMHAFITTNVTTSQNIFSKTFISVKIKKEVFPKKEF
jgi:hypothetical protein